MIIMNKLLRLSKVKNGTNNQVITIKVERERTRDCVEREREVNLKKRWIRERG